MILVAPPFKAGDDVESAMLLSFFSPDRKERNKEKVTAAFHPFLDGIFYSS